MLSALIGRRSFPVGAHCLPAESKCRAEVLLTIVLVNPCRRPDGRLCLSVIHLRAY